MSEFDDGFLVGLLVGEGHFGGDGRQPQITLRMHAKHEALFRWLERSFPGGRLYGPYEHSGRRYYQWMVRGAYLRDVIMPLLDRHLTPTRDGYAYERLAMMQTTYAKQLRLRPADPSRVSDAIPSPTRGAAPPTSPAPAEGSVDSASSVPPTSSEQCSGNAGRHRDADAIFSALRHDHPTETAATPTSEGR